MENNFDESTSVNQYAFEEADYDLKRPTWRLDLLKTAAIEQRLPRPRSLAWSILLQALPDPHGDIVRSLSTHRNFYDDLQTKLSMDPRAVDGDDPLSQNDKSAWNQHFCDKELKALILQDVVRTYPDEMFFRNKTIEDMMVRVLFFWARSHSYVGYRQGMHEILAPIILELHLDRTYASNDLCDVLKCYLSEQYLEHDSYMLFSTVMRGLEKFYTTGDIVPSSCGRLPSSKEPHSPNEVVRYLERVRENYLVPLDAELAAHLSECNISMELFGIRWLRLLFGREFPRADIPRLWGFIFADGPMLPNIHFVILAILMSLRSTLLDEDCGVALSALMRSCPAPVDYICALSLHLRYPLECPLPDPPTQNRNKTYSENKESWQLEQTGTGENSEGDSGSEGVAEGADVARELSTLALLRARLPAAATALAQALPKPEPNVQRPLQQVLQLASLLQCRNHTLIDVETALEASETGQFTEKLGRRQLVPVSFMGVRKSKPKQQPKLVNNVKEVPLQLFHQFESTYSTSDLPCLDPLRLRTE